MVTVTQRVCVGAALLLAIVSGSLVGSTRALPAHATTAPAGLPGHFGLGVAAAPDSTGLYGWMPNSGIAWDYAYQYLSGGVNTGSGWETWDANGQFPLFYAQGAASHHYIPVFSYYEMLQSNGACASCGEAQTDLSHLNNAGLMASYFQNFALLMQRLGAGTYNGITGYGGTTIVHVEPDLSGYAQQAVLNNAVCYGFCTGQGNDPSLLRAAVAGSGYAAVAAYPNTYQGFNWALLHLRDLYAPNVKLAFHVSDWTTGTDIGSDTSSATDPVALGQEAGSFAAASGITGVPSGTTSYDLLFNDVADRDAAYYKYVYNNPNVWWDRLNVTFPNFHRWESYIQALTQTTGRMAIIWQIPEGNQYFDTENNTTGHYQDNRAEYVFGHIAELAGAGIIGLLFGAGNSGSTVHYDGMNDGVTNPAAICTSDGLSSGQICANHTSSVSDDDGGYIRLQAQQYYAGGGYPLGSPPPTATTTTPTTNTPLPTPTKTALPPTSTTTPPPAVTPTPVAPTFTFNRVAESAPAVHPGSTETFTATITASKSISNELVDFEVYNAAGSKVWQAWQSPVSFIGGSPRRFTAAWAVPAAQSTGTYTLKLGVFTSSWSLQAWNNQAAGFAVR